MKMLAFDQAFALFGKICDMEPSFQQSLDCFTPQGAGTFYTGLRLGNLFVKTFASGFVPETERKDKEPDGRTSVDIGKHADKCPKFMSG
jgi:hypothetical protein